MSKRNKDAQWSGRYGPWALVTGASDGIGREMARELAGRGLNVLLVARRVALLEGLAAELRLEFAVEARVLQADLGDPSAVAGLIDATAGVDIGLLVAAAGFGTAGRFLETDIHDELLMVDVNCRAVLAMSKAFAARFAPRRRGGIVLFSSIVAFQGVPNSANYAATKAYIQALAEGLHGELESIGVDVLSCAPGPVESGFAARSDLRIGSAVKPDVVARQTLAALGSRTTVWPGLLSKILIGSLATLPRFARTVIMGRIMTGMTRHRYESKS